MNSWAVQKTFCSIIDFFPSGCRGDSGHQQNNICILTFPFNREILGQFLTCIDNPFFCYFWCESESRSVVSWLFATRCTGACQAPLSMEFSWQEYWSGKPFLLQGIFPNQGSNPGLPHCRQILYCLSHSGSCTNTFLLICLHILSTEIFLLKKYQKLLFVLEILVSSLKGFSLSKIPFIRIFVS